MNKLVLTILVMSVLIDPVLSANNTSNNVIDVRGGHESGHISITDPTMNPWIP
jgi:hypothetical protein